MRYYSLFKRLMWGMWILLFVVLVVPFCYFFYLLEKDLQQDALDTAVRSLNSLEWTLSQHEFTGLAELNSWIEDYAQVTGQRVSYIVGDQLVADSNIAFDDLGEVESHSARPEVMQAIREGLSVRLRHSSVQDANFIYAAKLTSNLRGVSMGVLRVAIPTSLLSADVSKGRWSMLGVFAASLLVGGGLCILATRPLRRNIRDMSRVAKEIGGGNHSVRMYEVPARELRPLVGALNSMAHNIQIQQTFLNERSSRFEALFGALREGVVVLDLDGHVREANPAAGKLFPSLIARDSSAVSLTLMEATMLPSLQDAVDTLRARIRAARYKPDGEQVEQLLPLQLETKAGKHLEAVFTVFGVESSGGILAVIRDVSEKERLERLRRDFVANVSHELKTPLTNVKGYTEALLDMERDNKDDADGKQQRQLFLQTIANNSERMNDIVQGLLSLARVEYHGESASLEDVDLVPLLREAVRNKELLVKERNLSVELSESAASANVQVWAQAEGLSEVLHNLLDNALKYADPGTTIDVGLKETASEVVISVKNTGPGIPASQRERIFERFYRLDQDASSRKLGSAGLGLAICKHIIMGFGGRIWVESLGESYPGRGVIFHVGLRRGSERQGEGSP
jgi:two-component system phosphate regulon sensor histidine kinase PhoR